MSALRPEQHIRHPHTVLGKVVAAHSCAYASEVQARGRGSPPVLERRPLSYFQEPERLATQKAKGSGRTVPMGSAAFPDAVRAGRAPTGPGYACACPVRRAGSPAPLPLPVEEFVHRKGGVARNMVVDGTRQRDGPRWSTPCPSHVFSPSGRAMFGPQDGCEGLRPPLPRKPM